MADIRADREHGVIIMTLVYESGKRVVEVTLKPNDHSGEVDAADVRVVKGKKLARDERYALIPAAKREFMAVLLEWLRPQPTHQPVASLVERVELSFALTLARYDPKDRVRFTPLGHEDMRVVQMLAQQVSDRVAKLHEEAREQKRKLQSGYLEDVKAGVIAQWREDTPCTEALRDFYSSVIGRAFAWKRGRVPYAQYTEAMKYLPGIKLAYGRE